MTFKSKIFINSLILLSLPHGIRSIEPQSIDQGQSDEQNSQERALSGFEQKASAEYSIFKLLLGLCNRLKATDTLGLAVFLFMREVVKIANKMSNGELNVRDFDRAINGKGKEEQLNWVSVNPMLTNYTVTLEVVNEIVDNITRERLVRKSEIDRLRIFVLGIIDYRIWMIDPSSTGELIIENRKRILERLDQILTDHDRFQNWKDSN